MLLPVFKFFNSILVDIYICKERYEKSMFFYHFIEVSKFSFKTSGSTSMKLNSFLFVVLQLTFAVGKLDEKRRNQVFDELQ
jgi:hypothetical protein